MVQNQDLVGLEKKLFDKQEQIDREKQELEREKDKLEKLKDEYREKLSKTSGMTADEAKKELLKEIEDKEAAIVARLIKEKEEEAKLTADKKAQEILDRFYASWRD
jgi:ribonuclease Y